MLPTTVSVIDEDLELTDRLNTVCEGLMNWLGALQRYEIIYKFEEELFDEDDKEYTAHIKRRFPYSQIFITWSRRKLRSISDLKLERYMTHELCHELLFGDFERQLEQALDTVSLTSDDSALISNTVKDLSEDVIDHMAHLLTRLRPPNGFTSWGQPRFV